uniref:Uncharacterized protein n=1 Tax=Periophthalmus magnuspinnatus TaxID=409849 RepID=A0A3B4AER6_9GOBI
FSWKVYGKLESLWEKFMGGWSLLSSILLNMCLWCFATNNCTDYPVTWLFPPASVCKLADARWGVCWLDREDEQYARRREESRQRSEER